jgi:hypothetical protein
MIRAGRNKVYNLVNSTNPWTTWTPTVTSLTGSITSYTINEARYRRYGRNLEIFVRFTIDNNGTGATTVQFTFPPGFNPIRVPVLTGTNSAGTDILAVATSVGKFNIVTFANAYPAVSGTLLNLRGNYRIAP